MGSSPVTPTTNFAECIHSVHSVFYIRSTCACANVETDIKTSTLCVPKFVPWNERSEYHETTRQSTSAELLELELAEGVCTTELCVPKFV